MFFRKDLIERVKKNGNIPKCIAIVMDGNGRWAQKRGLPRTAGHKMGVETVKKTTESCIKLGVKHLILYAFSTENWKRPKDEVDFLMKLPGEYFGEELNKIIENNVKITTIGDLSQLPSSTKETIEIAVERSENNTGLNLVFAINYGARQEILNATKRLFKTIKTEEINDITENDISKFIDSNLQNIPDPDLFIRPGGEVRISNFLLWQLAYSELFFISTLWPDFSEKHLCEAIDSFQNRERRYGGIKK
ncbi:isoprenyl transferase [Alkalicella caledoniensis]|uniref:Isoprenyl transferase n=1 Tax=Alkalicella caledoniensis TaxID=2731377 RepID=A0A7G9WCP0_ALKCA|nr:isoprenyl transferase [Alkalicella caledoniensis]QNO16452.1 isoprenyl transferase [Alkalicella caledoniensis]